MIYQSKFIITTKLPLDRLWAVLSDTSRMNKAMGLQPRHDTEVNGKRIVRTTMLGQEQEWVELPWTWIINKDIIHERHYKKGLMHKQIGVFRILPEKTSAGLTQVEINFTWYGNFILRYVIGPGAANFLKKEMPAYLQAQEKIFFSNAQAINTALTPLRKLNDGDKNFKAQILAEVNSAQPEKLKLILQNLIASDSLDIHKINPKKIATKTGLPLIDVVEQLTLLTHKGYLALTWDVVCPHCRGPQVESSQLRAIKNSAKCGPCDLEFAMQDERSLEVSFKPQSKFREVGSVNYCAAEPAKKTHILINWLVAKNETFTTSLNLKPGTYRARTLYGKKSCEVTVTAAQGPSQNISVDFTKAQIQIDSGNISLSYTAESEDYLIFESLPWSEETFLAGEALSNTHIRTLLNDDLLRSGVKLEIGEQIILFTDIVGSTPMYRKLGDSKAFVAVQDHYGIIETIIKNHSGVVVKFIGDAVMAAFTDASLAFKANHEIHQAFKNNKDSLVLRTSFHIGQILCVNMNVGLDYFGQTVNTAAKLQGWADGFETAVSEQTLARIPSTLRLQLSIKRTGFDEKLQETVHVY